MPDLMAHFGVALDDEDDPYEGTTWFHGTHREFRPGDLIKPGHPSNYTGTPNPHVYFTDDPDAASLWAGEAVAARENYHGETGHQPHVYQVALTHPDHEPDPEDEQEYDRRTRFPVRVVREVPYTPKPRLGALLEHFAAVNPPCHYCHEPLDDEDVDNESSSHEECQEMRQCPVHGEHDDPVLAEQHRDTYTDWGEHLPFRDGIHRGFPKELPPEVHDLVHDRSRPLAGRAHVLRNYLDREGFHGGTQEDVPYGTDTEGHLGVHWSPSRDVAKAWGTEDYDEGPHGGGPKPSVTHIVLHAKSPDYSHIETDPDHLEARHMYGYDHPRSEHEVPLKFGAPVGLTGISWKQGGQEEWNHHDFRRPEHHMASAGDPEAFPNPYHGSELGGRPEWSHTWFHGTKNSGPQLSEGRPPETRLSESESWPQPNKLLGTHFSPLHSVAHGFAYPMHGAAWTTPPTPGRPSALVHARLHFRDPAHFPTESHLNLAIARWADRESPHWHDAGLNKFLRGSYQDTEGTHKDWHQQPRDLAHVHHLGNMAQSVMSWHPHLPEILHGFTQHLIDQGHHGITYGNQVEGPYGSVSAIATRPSQIETTHVEHIAAPDREPEPHEVRYSREGDINHTPGEEGAPAGQRASSDLNEPEGFHEAIEKLHTGQGKGSFLTYPRPVHLAPGYREHHEAKLLDWLKPESDEEPEEPDEPVEDWSQGWPGTPHIPRRRRKMMDAVLHPDPPDWAHGMQSGGSQVEWVRREKLKPYMEFHHDRETGMSTYLPTGHEFPDRYSPERWDAMDKSMAEKGMHEPVLLEYNPWTRRMHIGEGHHRLESAERAGHEMVPVWGLKTSQEHPHARAVPGEPKVKPEHFAGGYFPSSFKPSDVLPTDWMRPAAANGSPNHYQASSNGDRHVQCSKGHTHWGAYGAAGLLIRYRGEDGQQRYLLQKRSPDVNEPDTWCIPGGAIGKDETPEQGAWREAREEIGSIPKHVSTHHIVKSTDCGDWAYHTVVADAGEHFMPGGRGETQHETAGVGWHTAGEIEDLREDGDLHPGFARSWDTVRRSRGPKTAVIPREAARVPEGPYYHGTSLRLRKGEHIRPASETGRESLYGDLGEPGEVTSHTHATTDLGNAADYAKTDAVMREEGGRPYVYKVRPLGEIEQDPIDNQGIRSRGHMAVESVVPGHVWRPAHAAYMETVSESRAQPYLDAKEGKPRTAASAPAMVS
jgi:8-oxo-dGTP diphosphatase